MSPVAVHTQEPLFPTDPTAKLKADARVSKQNRHNDTMPLPVYPEPVARDYMYKFKYNHPLPTHGAGAIEIPEATNPRDVAQEIVSQLSQALSSGDAEQFSGLFMEHGVWRDRALFTWEYRSFNFRQAIHKAASDLLPTTPVHKVTLIEPYAKVERPYGDMSFIQAHISLETELAGGTALINIIKTEEGYKIWTMTSTMESLHGFPEVPERDGHMTGPHAWDKQREIDLELQDVEPEVLIIGGGQNGLMLAARLQALGVKCLIIERNKRIGDNWRGRYEALSLHLPHWADHFAYMPYPQHWPAYCPAGKLADWFEWYVSALELHVWTSSTVTEAKQLENGEWSIEVERAGKGKRTFHPKQLVMATSLAGVPYSPTIPGRDQFKGTVRHSTEHDSSREWVGKKALVVGTSSSGFDTAYDFARRGVEVTLLQRSPTYIMSLIHSVPRILGAYKPDGKKRPDIEISDRIHHGLPVGPSEEMGRRLGTELTELDMELLQGLEAKGFQTWRGQRSTSTQTLGYTKNGGFYFDAGACEQILNGNIKVEQGYIDHFDEDKVVLNGDRERDFDIVVLATGFSNTIDSVRKTLGDDVADRFGPIWGMNEEGELNAAWKTKTGVPNLWLMVGTLQAARYHSRMVALRIKAQLENIAPEPYLA